MTVRVTVELLPGGNASRARHLGTAIITNLGEGTPHSGHYSVTLSKKGQPSIVWRSGRVDNFPRKRLGSWDLLFRALRATVGGRNP